MANFRLQILLQKNSSFLQLEVLKVFFQNNREEEDAPLLNTIKTEIIQA